MVVSFMMDPDGRIRFVRLDSLRRCVSAGLGLGFMRESSALPYLDLENMKGVPLSDDWADSSLISVFPKGPDVSPVVDSFLKLLNTQG